MTSRRRAIGRIGQVVGGALLASVGLVGAAGAQPASPETAKLLIGTTYCFQVRCADGDLTPQQRVDHAHEIFTRHLGSGRGVFTLQKSGKSPAARVRILLNGEQVITVTTQDAKATRFLNAEDLAPLWKASLEKAFSETSATMQPSGG